MSNFYCTKCHKVIDGSSKYWGIHDGLPYCLKCLKIVGSGMKVHRAYGNLQSWPDDWYTACGKLGCCKKHITTNNAKVTCKKCLKIIEQEQTHE
jgi:NAD-dependent SIR2 family protein deacetylase